MLPGGATLYPKAADFLRAVSTGQKPEVDLDPEMVAIAGAIVRQRIGKFDRARFSVVEDEKQACRVFSIRAGLAAAPAAERA
jgi:hypothetical protein